MTTRREWMRRAFTAAVGVPMFPALARGRASPPSPEIEAIIERLSIEQKIGQMLMVGVSGTGMTEETADLLREIEPGALILLGRNVRTPEQLAEFTAALQQPFTRSPRSERERAGDPGIPRFISMDQEGGIVVRLSRGASVFPGAMATGATGSTGLAFLEGRVTGSELHALGVNMNLAPVLDVNSNRDNPVIGVRSYGDDPRRVAAMGRAYALGLQSAGVAAVAKHFPGHGDAVEDSHRGLPSIRHDLDRLRRVELVPFGAAADAGIDAMMSAHLLFPRIDSEPATMSRILLTRVLREELGFDGILMSDDLEMKAIDGGIGIGPAAVKSIAAGADMQMIIWRRKNKETARDALLAAVRDGRLPLERVDQAVRRVLAVKKRRGILVPDRDVNAAVAVASVGNPHHLRVAREIASRAITVVWNRDGALPCAPARAPLLVVLSSSDGFLAEMRAARPGSIEIHLPLRPDAASRARVLATAGRLASRAARFVISVSNEDQVALAGALASRVARPVVGVALGAPYLLDGVSAIAAHVCAYGWRPDSLRAAARVVAGLDEAGGFAPVQLTLGPDRTGGTAPGSEAPNPNAH